MKITRTQLRQLIKDQLQEASVKGATFHKDPMTGEWVTGGEDFEGPGAQAAQALRRPEIKGVGTPAALSHPEVDWDDFAPYGMDQIGEAFMAAGGDPMEALQILQMEAMAAGQFEDEDEDEDDDYEYGDDPDEFLDLPAGEIQRRMRGED